MSYNTSSSHQLIPNAQQYMLHYKFVTINSDDRDITKYQNSSEFEIDLPQDYVNVQTVKLNSWSFPNKYDVFGEQLNNVTFIFRIAPYYTVSSTVYLAPVHVFTVTIETGSYTPSQMATELTNKMNQAVNVYIQTININATTYTDFLVEYHEVNEKLWFGNNNSQFILENGSATYLTNEDAAGADCLKRSNYKQYINWGLPYFLGFTRVNTTSDVLPADAKFYYKSSAKWLTSTVLGGTSNYIVADYKLNLNGPSHFYVEIAGMNNMDETMPKKTIRYTTDNSKESVCKSNEPVCKKTLKTNDNTNESNGIVNSCFAKIPVPIKSDTDWFNTNSDAYMLYNPPAEKIRRLRIRIRYHNNSSVQFDNFEFSFVLQLGLILPQNEKKYTIYIPESVSKCL